MKLLMMWVCNMDPFLLTALHWNEEGALKTHKIQKAPPSCCEQSTYQFLNKKQILTLILKLPKSFYPCDCKFVCPKADFNVIKWEQRQIKRQISIHLQADWCEPNKRCFKSNDSINSEGTEKRGIQRWNCSPELRKKNCV